jgi:hypothetical protein
MMIPTPGAEAPFFFECVLEAMLRIALFKALQEAAEYRQGRPQGKRRFNLC